LKAPVTGTVRTVGAVAGEQVALGAQLFVVEPVSAGSTTGPVSTAGGGR